MLISAYFLSRNSGNYLKKILIIGIQVWITSVLILLAFASFSQEYLNLTDVLTAIFPIVLVQHWYPTAYIMLLAFSPLLNRLLANLGRDLQSYAIGIMIIFWGVLELLPGVQFFYTRFALFLLLYFLADFIRKYFPLGSPKKWALCSLLLILLLALCVGSLQAATSLLPSLTGRVLFLTNNTSPLTLTLALSVFCLFRSMPARHHRPIYFTSGLIFRVYLIHENPLVRELIWQRLLPHGNSLANSSVAPLILIGGASAVFFCCLALEFLRKTLIQNPLMKILENSLLRNISPSNLALQKWLSAKVSHALGKIN